MRSLVLLGLALAGACSIYDESLLEGSGKGGEGGDGTTQSSTQSTGAAGHGGATLCTAPGDCPGMDGPCQTRTCEGGFCGVQNNPPGVPIARQTPGDCQEVQCDGMGAELTVGADGDVEDDNKECTTDACARGLPTHTAKSTGTKCSQGGGTVCNADSDCVECVVDGDCASNVCDDMFTCAPAMCGDTVKNGAETDVDCGGAMCPPCPTGKQCMMGSDCVGGICTGGTCVPSCTDGLKNGSETDIDCGGSCPKCDIGQTCNVAADCTTNNCNGAKKCECGGTHLLLSEIRTRGALGGSDELIEIYNPTSSAVTLDATWKVDARGTGAMTYGVRWTGPAAGISLPAHGHYLIVGSAYAGMTPADASLSSGVTDAVSIRLVQGASTIIDAVCLYFNATTLAVFQNDATYTCEGTPTSNLPHNDSTAGQSNTDVSIERKPGAAGGNCIDTADSAADWKSTTPANPQDLASPPAP